MKGKEGGSHYVIQRIS